MYGRLGSSFLRESIYGMNSQRRLIYSDLNQLSLLNGSNKEADIENTRKSAYQKVLTGSIKTPVSSSDPDSNNGVSKLQTKLVLTKMNSLIVGVTAN